MGLSPALVFDFESRVYMLTGLLKIHKISGENVNGGTVQSTDSNNYAIKLYHIKSLDKYARRHDRSDYCFKLPYYKASIEPKRLSQMFLELHSYNPA